MKSSDVADMAKLAAGAALAWVVVSNFGTFLLLVTLGGAGMYAWSKISNEKKENKDDAA